MEPVADRVRDTDFIRQVEVGRQESRGISNADAARCRDNSGLSLARRKDATCFLRWTMSMMTDSTILACHQRAIGSKTLERRVSTEEVPEKVYLESVPEYWDRKGGWF